MSTEEIVETESQETEAQEVELERPPIFEDFVDHNIRLLVFTDGLLIIGYLQGIEGSIINVRLPFEIQTENTDFQTMVAYDIVPFLDALAPFAINSPAGISFNMNNLISITVPNPHLLRNYNIHLWYRKQYQDEIDGVVPEETMH